MEEIKSPPQDKACACAPRALARRRALPVLALFFTVFAWITALYSVGVLAFNWSLIIKSPSPDRNLLYSGVIASVVQLLMGTAVTCFFIWASQITKLLLDMAAKIDPERYGQK
ncbi:MAG: hypothetical protein WC421_05855 [Elusimicrobiales bacterium]